MVAYFFKQNGAVWAPLKAPILPDDWTHSAVWELRIYLVADARLLATVRGQILRAGLKVHHTYVRPGHVIQPIRGREDVTQVLAAAEVDTSRMLPVVETPALMYLPDPEQLPDWVWATY